MSGKGKAKEAVTIESVSIERAQTCLANALKRRPGIELDLVDVIAYVGLPPEPEPVVEGDDVPKLPAPASIPA